MKSSNGADGIVSTVSDLTVLNGRPAGLAEVEGSVGVDVVVTRSALVDLQLPVFLTPLLQFHLWGETSDAGICC